MTRDDQETIRQILREELMLDMPHEIQQPPPGDGVAEQILIAAVLNGEHKPAEFPQLEADHFSEPLRRAVWSMAGALVEAGHKPQLEPILKALQEQGFAGRIAEHLVCMRNKSPSVALLDLREYAARVTELWRRRRMIECLAQVAVELRCGATRWADARVRIENHIAEYAA